MIVYKLEQRFAKWACDRLTEDADFRQKKIFAFRAQKTRKHTLKSRRNQIESLFGADFDSEA